MKIVLFIVTLGDVSTAASFLSGKAAVLGGKIDGTLLYT
jgi:hypothetical protein